MPGAQGPLARQSVVSTVQIHHTLLAMLGSSKQDPSDLSSLSPPTFSLWRRVSTLPTASPRFCLQQWITSFSFNSFLWKLPTSFYSLILIVHGCPLPRISQYEFLFPLSRKASNPLTTKKKWIKNKAVNFPHENSLKLHTFAPGHASLMCPSCLRCIPILCPGKMHFSGFLAGCLLG